MIFLPTLQVKDSLQVHYTALITVLDNKRSIRAYLIPCGRIGQTISNPEFS